VSKFDARLGNHWSTIMFSRTGGMNSRTRKLDEEKVYAIREDWDKGMSSRDGGKKYGISHETFAKVGKRYSWKCLPERKHDGTDKGEYAEMGSAGTVKAGSIAGNGSVVS